MTKPEKHYVEHENLSLAWGEALQLVTTRGRTEVVPLIVGITGFDNAGRPKEEHSVRAALDTTLSGLQLQNCHTVANTIFPEAFWNPSQPRALFFERYLRAYPKIKAASHQNRRGLYFHRMITGGPEGAENQLEFILNAFTQRQGTRRSILQVVVFDPKRDHSNSALLGFPCLQHVTFAPEDDGLCVNAFYAAQYMVQRAYGNYLGLCGLGRFVAHELGLPLKRVTCFAGVAQFDPGAKKKDVRTVLDVVDQLIPQTAQSEAQV